MSTPSPLTTREAASVLGCTVRHVARLVTAGKLTPAYVTPCCGAMTFAEAELERYQTERGTA